MQNLWRINAAYNTRKVSRSIVTILCKAIIVTSRGGSYTHVGLHATFKFGLMRKESYLKFAISGHSLALEDQFTWLTCYLPHYIFLQLVKVPLTLIFFYFGRKVKSSMDTNSKKTIKLFTSFHGFWSQKDKNLSFDRADRGLVPMT